MENERSIFKVDLECYQNEKQNNIGLNFKAKGHQEDLNTHDDYFSVHNVDLPKISAISESVI